MPLILLAVYFLVLMARFAYIGELYLSFFTDDFFYYLVVARNLALHGTSTFNGLQLTNGYHPLWLLAMTFLYRVFGGHLALFLAIVLFIWVLVCASYYTLRRTQQLLHLDREIGLGCALLSITFMALISRTGMEVSLALLCLTLFWHRMSARPLDRQASTEAFFSGLLASALVLSRIDACLVVAVYIILTLVRPCVARRKVIRNILWFGAGLLPLALYAGINQFEFGAPLPISGLAKNMKDTLLPSVSTVGWLCTPTTINVLFTWPSVVCCALFLLHSNRRGIVGDTVEADKRRVQYCVALHPIIFYSVLSFSSDWPIWTWYLYPLVPVGALLGPVLVGRLKPSRSALLWMTASIACGSLVILLNLARINPGAFLIYEQAVELRAFAVNHPGRYAMGDDAGTPGYLMAQPIVQLEGLMGDKPFLNRIRHQEPLLAALQELGIDYYVTTDARPNNGCYEVREPSQAGPRSPAMRGRLCMKPLAVIRPLGSVTMIFDVRR